MSGPISHRGPSQTLPDIFVAYNNYPVGETSAGSFHQWGLSLTLGGARQLKVGGSELLETEGDLLFSRPHVDMSWHACGAGVTGKRQLRKEKIDECGWETIYAAFHPRPHWMPWLSGLGFVDGIAVIRIEGEAFRELVKTARELYDTYNRHHPLRDDWSLLALERFLMVVRSYINLQQIAKDTRVQAVVQAIHLGFSSPLSSQGLARDAGISVTRMISLFKESMGTTPGEYVEHVRLEIAADRLSRTSAPIRSIAFDCGYPDANYFARRFRTHYGQSPSEYREASRSQTTRS